MRTATLTLLAALLLSCGPGAGSDDVGGECSNDRDCDSVCTLDDTFGTGMCTRKCSTDNDCPEGTACVEKGDGVCAVTCQVADDCEDFGRGFACKELKRQSGGETLVCRTP